jgi:hypothetical protein
MEEQGPDEEFTMSGDKDLYVKEVAEGKFP